MVRLLSILATALVVPAAVLAQTATAPPAVQAGPPVSAGKPANVTDGCGKTLAGFETSLKCLKPVESTSTSDLAARCSAPADGADGHYCKEEQINTALDAMESSCKAELSAGNKMVLSAYGTLSHYEKNRVMMCLKAPSGNGGFVARNKQA
ncbi:hypothetical protein SYNPS1DRAFT_28518 [Syncephalis pseudoplumigaleata]|uniref:Uncharacterized protein n=1 Tax=Syncephalis pseudoplumigaleata TaxID=1712513 RepID=A0A4P9YZZ5_9FUNG|nr:hypothetical protein SYNPS1DRAFT_28518 [Syncephalis pseudoplumigaleata]|eukprot:RKP25757.1 hypothetical protein SYNPS1DRAFT_28518 [Syncephalis pseudoplumigaleata]